MRTYCPDCGPAGVSHWVERWSARIDPLFNILTTPMQRLVAALRPTAHALNLVSLIPLLYRTSAAMGLGAIVTGPDEKHNWRTRVLWDEAVRRGIVMLEFRPFGLAREIFWSTFGGRTYVFDGLPRPHDAEDGALFWMDNKGIILKKFRAANIPVPQGGTCATFREAKSIFETIGGSVIVKPNIGSRSRHTYVGISDLHALRRAFMKAKELTPRPVVQEELRGFVFRITLVGGAIAGIMRREPPHVIGDGVHTLGELVEAENKNPLRQGPIFHELQLEAGADANVIVPKGHMATLNDKVSRSYGASTTEFEMSEVHPDNLALFLKIGNVLDNPLVGVDFMIEDIARSWREQPKCGVIECNSLPFIDLHTYPLRGKAKNVAGDVWDLCYPGSNR